MINYSEALDLLKSHLITLGTETVDLLDATERFLAEDILADRDYPPFNRSAMDGFAVNSEWYNALDKKAMANQGKCFAGESFSKEVDSSKALKTMTGAPVPEGLDAVIKIEECDDGCDLIQFEPQNVTSHQNIAKKGEDAQKGMIVLNKGAFLSPQNFQLLATLGIQTVKVIKTPTVSIITTGDEVKDIDEPVDWFQIRNSNKYALLSSLKSLGIKTKTYVHVADDENRLSEEIENALNTDLLILTGGVSMGEADYVPSTLAKHGIEKVFHKIAMKPGKPIWFGKNDQTAVFGLPGNPLSTFHAFNLIIKPYLAQIQGSHNQNNFVSIPLHSTIKPARIDRFFPFKLTDGKAEIKKFNGSGDITASKNTNGIVFLPKEKEVSTGDLVECLFY